MLFCMLRPPAASAARVSAAADAAGGLSMQINMQFLLQFVKGFLRTVVGRELNNQPFGIEDVILIFFAILITICNHCIGNSQQQNAKPTAPWPSPQPHHQHEAKVQQKTER